MSTQPNYGGGMSPRTKTALFVGVGVLVVGIFAFILLRKKDPKNEDFNFPSGGGGTPPPATNSPATNPPATNTPPPAETAPNVIPPYDPKADIRQLKDAMDGVGTNENKMQQVIDRTTREQRQIIQRTWDSQLGSHGGETLMEWIDGEFFPDWLGTKQQDAFINAFY
tara:strand:+ start:2957 stop:3457 length:501 start_codon:yes stop_codon:yes gene_type:complete